MAIIIILESMRAERLKAEMARRRGVAASGDDVGVQRSGDTLPKYHLFFSIAKCAENNASSRKNGHFDMRGKAW